MGEKRWGLGSCFPTTTHSQVLSSLWSAAWWHCSRNIFPSYISNAPSIAFYGFSVLSLPSAYTWAVLTVTPAFSSPTSSGSLITDLILLLSWSHTRFPLVFLKRLYFTYFQNCLFSPFTQSKVSWTECSISHIVFHKGLTHGSLFQFTIS